MPDFNIILPSKPRVVSEDSLAGVYEIEGLYPGYGHTLGNSLRRIILSSLPGYAITSVKIDGISHEFSAIDGVKEDVITIILNLRRVRFRVVGDGPQSLSLNAKGAKEIKAGDLEASGQVEIVNKDQHIATLTDKNSSLNMEILIEKGLGYVPKDILRKEKVDVGEIAVDANFTTVRRVSYEVENMRVGNRTDFNKLTIHIETDGELTPREALEKSIEIMIQQLKAVVGFKEDVDDETETELSPEEQALREKSSSEDKEESETTRLKVEDLDLSARTSKALTNAGIRTLGGLTRKKETDLKDVDGLGDKGIQEIKDVLANHNLALKD